MKDFNFQTWLSDSRLLFEFKISDELDKYGNMIQTSSEITHYMGLDFIHTLSGQCYIKGSIHRFFNAGGNNHDFSYLIYGVMGLLSAIFVWKIVPETKGKSLEDMEKLWMKN